MLIAIALFSLWHLLLPSLLSTIQKQPQKPEFAITGGNAIIGVIAPFIPQTAVRASIINPDEEFYWFIWSKYPAMTDLLMCMLEKESTYGLNMEGDDGLAFGYFQIWISVHPEVSYDCAMNFECSLDYTYKMINMGKGYLWTTYSPCGEK